MRELISLITVLILASVVFINAKINIELVDRLEKDQIISKGK